MSKDVELLTYHCNKCGKKFISPRYAEFHERDCNMSKTPEEKARKYAGKADESRRGFQDYIIVETKYKSFLEGYHYRDEEVKELREALKECIENIECIEANVNHSEGFFSALMNATVFCEQAKQLLNKE